MTTQPLYAIAADLEQIAEELTINGGELTPDLEARLTDATETFARKVEQYGLWRLSAKANIGAIKEEEQRLAARRKAVENGIARLDAYFMEHMEAQDMPKVKTPLLTVGVQNSPPSYSCEFEDAEEIPPEVREKVEPLPPYRFSAKKAALYYIGHKGQLPEGVTRHQSKHLRVR